MPVGRQGGRDLPDAVDVAVEGAGEVGLAGEIGPVADPDGQRLGAELLPGFDAGDVVRDGLGADGGVGMGEGAIFV